MRPDDSLLEPHQLVTVRRCADHLLSDASAVGRYPTPIDDLMAAAKLTVVSDEVLNDDFLHQFVRKARSGLRTIKSAWTKVLSLFDAEDRIVVMDKAVPGPRIPFVKLHEAGHGSLPHQNRVYRFIHDCAKTLDADVTDLFEREANVFASEVLFQGELFTREAEDRQFGIKVPISLAKKFGSSNYAAFRRYVTTNHHACCVVVLEEPIWNNEGGFTAVVRRVIASQSFQRIYDSAAIFSDIGQTHAIAPAVPRFGKRMTFVKEILLTDRNRATRVCLAEGFDTKHQVLVLVRDLGEWNKAGLVVPRELPATALRS